MKLQSPTLILVFVAIALGSFVAVTELRPTPPGDDGESQALFDFEEKEVRSLVVETASRTLKFEKEAVPSDSAELDDAADTSTSDGDAEADGEPEKKAEETGEGANDSPESAPETLDAPSSEESADNASASDSSKEDEEDSSSDDDEADETIETASEWQMRSPDEAPADDSSVVFLVNLMASGVSDRVFEVEPENLDDFGFDSPLAEVEVTLENDESHRLILGNYDFNGKNIYAQALSPEESTVNTEQENEDSESPEATSDESVQVFIVSTSFDSAVNRPLEEWKQTEEDQAEEQADDSEDAENTADSSEPNTDADFEKDAENE